LPIQSFGQANREFWEALMSQKTHGNISRENFPPRKAFY